MPWYDYRCEECEETFEVRRSMSEDDGDQGPVCPECGGEETSRLFGNVFAGGGSQACEPSGKA